ncbi:patched family protein [Cooperia oncophora]
MLAMVILCVLSISYYYEALDVGKMDSGVDALFLMMYSWQKMVDYNYTPSERLGIVFEECGPSITITSVTNVLAFGIGAITPTPGYLFLRFTAEVRLFCLGSAIAIFLTFVYQLILFGPALAIATSYENTDKIRHESQLTGCRALINSTFLTLLRVHCTMLRHVEVAVIVFIMAVIYLTLGVYGWINMDIRLDSEKILPTDSELHRPNGLLMKYVWREHLSPVFLVNNRFNLTDTRLTAQFWSVLKELEALPHCKGAASSHVWLRDFADSLNKSGGLYPYHTKLIPEKVKNFLKHDRRHFDMTIRFSNDPYRDLNMTVYESAGFYVDQMLSLSSVTVQTALFTLASMTVVCAIFMGNICEAETAISNGVILGVIGFMSLFGFDLDPVVMVALLMSIGMSVDYIAHVAYHLQVDTKSKISGGSVVRTPISGIIRKVQNTVECVALPLAQSGLSTISCVLPLLFLPTYASSVFVTAIVLVVIFGALHSLIIIPVFLIRLPEWITSGRIMRSCTC